MALFGRKKEEDFDDEEYEVEERSYRKIHDLKPENKRVRKEPLKPWGKKERYIVLGILVLTIFISGALALSARDYKLPGLPKINLKNPFKNEVIVIGNKNPYSKILDAFKEKTKNLSGTYSLYVLDLTTNKSFGIGENNIMQAASLIKLPVMLYMQGKVDDSKIEAMGKRSDNAVFVEMRKKFGDKILQDYIKGLGMENTSLEKNETTPKEMGELLKKIFDDKQSLAGEAGKSEKMLGYLTDTIFENWLRAGIPDEIRVSHKYGREVHVVNDAGIIFTKKPFIIVIMTKGVVEKEVDEIFPDLARLVYDGMTK